MKTRESEQRRDSEPDYNDYARSHRESIRTKSVSPGLDPEYVDLVWDVLVDDDIMGLEGIVSSMIKNTDIFLIRFALASLGVPRHIVFPKD